MKDGADVGAEKQDRVDVASAPLVDMAVPHGPASELDRLRLASEQHITPEMGESWWQQVHDDLVKQAQTTDAQLQFYGDSITNYIGNGNLDTFQKNFAALKPQNFGIPGDTTDDVLWRVNHGELSGHPKLRVLLIGTNDLTVDPGRSAQETAQNIADIVKTMRLQDPSGKILVMGILPRDADNDPLKGTRQAKREEINHLLAGLDNGKTVRFLDIGSRFVTKAGGVNQDLLPDNLHPSHAGYQVWSDAIKPVVDEMTK